MVQAPLDIPVVIFAVVFFALFCRAHILRAVTLLPIIGYPAHDLRYRLLSKKKPVHHPEKWPPGLVVYLILLQAGAIGLNWCG